MTDYNLNIQEEKNRIERDILLKAIRCMGEEQMITPAEERKLMHILESEV